MFVFSRVSENGKIKWEEKRAGNGGRECGKVIPKTNGFDKMASYSNRGCRYSNRYQFSRESIIQRRGRWSSRGIRACFFHVRLQQGI